MKKTLFILLSIALLAMSMVAANPVIMPYNCDGTEATNEFTGEEVCLYGLGFEADQEVDIYILNDKENYTIGEEIVPLHKETITANENGFLGLQKVWNSIVTGVYDFVADIGSSLGFIDEKDVVNAGNPVIEAEEEENNDEEENIEEVPEFSSIMAIAVLAAAGIFISKKRKEVRS